MSAKSFFIVCASALFVHSVASNCLRAPALSNCGSGLGYNGLNGGIVSSGVAASSGGGFPVALISPIAPRGLSVLSENSIHGNLEVYGQLPFLAAVALEGQLPSSGSAGVSYSCGDNVGISSQSLSAAGVGAANAAGFRGRAGLSNGLVGSSCGCSSIY